jgi:hypothetical protein
MAGEDANVSGIDLARLFDEGLADETAGAATDAGGVEGDESGEVGDAEDPGKDADPQPTDEGSATEEEPAAAETPPASEAETALTKQVALLTEQNRLLMERLYQPAPTPPPPVAPAPKGPAPAVRDALRVALSPGLSAEERAKQFAGFPGDVRAEAMRLAEAYDRRVLDDAADPDGALEARVSKLVEEQVQTALQPTQQAAYWQGYQQRHAALLGAPGGADLAAGFVKQGYHPEVAAQLAGAAMTTKKLEAEVAALRKEKDKVELQERDQRGVKGRQRAAAGRAPDRNGEKKLDLSKMTDFEDVARARGLM